MEFEPVHFNPLQRQGGRQLDDGTVAFRASDEPGDIYLYAPRVILALNVALATGRPLLIYGEPGSGKTTLAWNASRVLGWRYYKRMITSRTQASDLLWTFDALSRLNDATAGELRSREQYVEPGTLWWAFHPETAEHRGTRAPLAPADRAQNPWQGEASEQAVVLIDEIDKADPNVPNDLLEAFDIRAFTVSETRDRVSAPRDRSVLMILTSNSERELPPAFLRRCVALTLSIPEDTEKEKLQENWFVQIANQRRGDADQALHRDVARENGPPAHGRPQPGQSPAGHGRVPRCAGRVQRPGCGHGHGSLAGDPDQRAVEEGIGTGAAAGNTGPGVARVGRRGAHAAPGHLAGRRDPC